MLRAGNTAFRTRQWMDVLARGMGMDGLSVSLALGSVTASVRRGDARATMTREIGPPAVNASRIGGLERLAKTAVTGLASSEIAARLAEIEAAPPRYSDVLVAAAVGLACGAFAFLNGGAVPEGVAAAIGAGISQRLRAWLSGRQFNQYGVTALCAVVGAGIYALIAAGLGSAGVEMRHYAAGFISSVLFLVPGFPLVAALLDLLQY